MAFPKPSPSAPGTAPVRQASLREHNLGMLLRQVAARPDQSRTSLAALTGLSKATVSSLVEELLQGRLVTEVEPVARAGAGRPSAGLRLDPQGGAGLGLEVNVDYASAAVLDLAGQIRYHETTRADLRALPPAEALALVETLAARALAAADGQDLRVGGATLAVPGLVQGNLVRLAPNLDWVDVAVPDEIAGVATAVDNESNLAALGEMAANPTLPRSFVYVSGEIGIGAGIVVDGELVRGERGFGGELGHLIINPDGPACHCGGRGCLEQYAGQDAIRLAAGRPAPPDGVPAGVADFVALAEAGNLPMRNALQHAGEALGVAIAGTVNLLDLGTVVLGGNFAALEPWLRRPVEREVDRRVLSARWTPVRIEASVLGADAAVRGAAGAVLRSILDNPVAWIAR